jgi:hypothetical protein
MRDPGVTLMVIAAALFLGAVYATRQVSKSGWLLRRRAPPD